jgi:hypothetical protein
MDPPGKGEFALRTATKIDSRYSKHRHLTAAKFSAAMKMRGAGGRGIELVAKLLPADGRFVQPADF